MVMKDDELLAGKTNITQGAITTQAQLVRPSTTIAATTPATTNMMKI
jgi:hypothetical protein